VKCSIILLVTMCSPRFKISDASIVVCSSRSGRRLDGVWSVVNLRVGWLAGEVHVKPLSHADDGAVEPLLTVARNCCWVILTMMLLSRCWAWHDVDTRVVQQPSSRRRISRRGGQGFLLRGHAEPEHARACPTGGQYLLSTEEKNLIGTCRSSDAI
jgi:hypothetical protein